VAQGIAIAPPDRRDLAPDKSPRPWPRAMAFPLFTWQAANQIPASAFIFVEIPGGKA
jgi:hypothetical protein